MVFLFGRKLDSAIRRIMQSRDVRCAVAFWGRGANSLFPDVGQQNIRIVCNLKSGGTNPQVISDLCRSGVKLRHYDELHAKVYIGKEQAIVASANASANGLGFEATEQARWIEAGVMLNDIDSVASWFEQIWDDAREVNQADINAAIAAWKFRRSVRPSLVSFADFDVKAGTLPFIAWWVSPADFVWCEENLKKQLGPINKEIKQRLENSIEIGAEEDKKVLRPGIWILFWERTASGLPSKRSNPYWFKVGRVVHKAFAYKSNKREKVDIMLPAEQGSPPPFEITEVRFRQAFYDLLKIDKYEYLRGGGDENSWYAPRQQLIHQFWRDLKCYYKKLGS
jgi:hypothetical protein